MIEFYLNPKNWFLPEREKKIKLIQATLSGETLDRALADMIINEEDRKVRHLNIDLEYRKISAYEFATKKAELSIKDQDELVRSKLDIDLYHKIITQQQYDHKLADLNSEPYVAVLGIDFDEKSPSNGYFELDFNEHFVEYLANNGYNGIEPEEIVNEWFSDLCKNIVLEDMVDDKGNPKSFLTDSKEGQLVQRLKVDDNFSEYS
jgi:hypothetical protein